MHSTLRKPFAAALLLVPLAAVSLAQQAHADTFRHHEHRTVLRDNRAPRVNAVTPANGARIDDHGRTSIAAFLSDDGSGVDPRSVRLRVDGRDVTRAARVTPSAVSYREDLRPGRHVAEVQVRDHAGNATRTAWSFDVARWPHRG